MRKLFLFLLVLPLWATTISDTIYTPMGALWTGSIVLDCPSGVDAAGRTIRALQATYQVRNGVFSATVDAGDAGAPVPRACTATYYPKAGKSWPETWLVPTSATALKISDVQTGPIPVPPAQLQPSQIGGGNNGQFLCKVGSTSAWCAAPAGAGGGLDPHATWTQIKDGTAGTGAVTLSMTWAQIKGL